MKAYVIKNKDLYKTTNSRTWTKDISECAKWNTFAKANQYIKDCYLKTMKDCEIVEITIAEGDLEKEIEQLNKYLELDWAMTPQRMDGKSMTKRKIIEDWEKEIRHQVCEEIRKWCQNDWDYDDFMYFLDKIGKGEKDE